MVSVRFCNYNVDYQQRLGFLKLVTWVGESTRGGKEDLLRRIEALYSPSTAKPTHARKNVASHSQPRLRGSFDPEQLLRQDAIPSWQLGFSFQRLDRLLVWAEMVGLITSSGRLSEWARPLLAAEHETHPADRLKSNPFLLTRRERALFLALLVYHDHVLFHLLSILATLRPGTQVDVRKGCIEVVEALGRTLDEASGTNIQAVRSRHALRDLLERISVAEGSSYKGALLNTVERAAALTEMAGKAGRNHLAEYHAVCRFEQLTDLGLLVKESPLSPPRTDAERHKARTSWTWYCTKASASIGEHIQATRSDVDQFLQHHWARSCSLAQDGDLRRLDVETDLADIARLLDNALPRARRQLGAIQVHTWVLIAALDAIDQGMELEFAAAFVVLDAMRQDPRYSSYIRQSGQQTYLGRTASVLEGTMTEMVSRYPLTEK